MAVLGRSWSRACGALAIRPIDGSLNFRPDPDLLSSAGDLIVVSGHSRDLEAMEADMRAGKNAGPEA